MTIRGAEKMGYRALIIIGGRKDAAGFVVPANDLCRSDDVLALPRADPVKQKPLPGKLFVFVSRNQALGGLCAGSNDDAACVPNADKAAQVTHSVGSNVHRLSSAADEDDAHLAGPNGGSQRLVLGVSVASNGSRPKTCQLTLVASVSSPQARAGWAPVVKFSVRLCWVICGIPSMIVTVFRCT